MGSEVGKAGRQLLHQALMAGKDIAHGTLENIVASGTNVVHHSTGGQQVAHNVSCGLGLQHVCTAWLAVMVLNACCVREALQSRSPGTHATTSSAACREVETMRAAETRGLRPAGDRRHRKVHHRCLVL